MRSHAIMDDVIGVRVMEFHASIHVVIGIRVVLCHPLVHNFVFPLRVPILILLSCCDNSSQLSPVVILHTFCTEEICHLRCGIYTRRMSVSWRRAIHPCAWCPALNITEFLVVADTMLGFCRADALCRAQAPLHRYQRRCSRWSNHRISS